MPEDASRFLGPPQTADYRPSVYGTGMIQSLYTGQVPLFLLGEVEAMRSDPRAQLAVAILRAPLARLKWQVKAANSQVARYIDETLRRVWTRSLRQISHYLEYGNAAGEPLWAIENGLVHYQSLRDVYPRDAVPLVHQGGLCGIEVKNVKKGPQRLYPPRAFWVAHRPRHGSYYGYSRYQGAWWPWLEKRGRHGATDVRRLWYIKNAFRGGIIRHPPGMMDRGDGTLQSCQDYAREILEKAETGGVLALPNAKDPNTGEYLWVYEEAKVNGDLSGVHEYTQDLDAEQLEGFEIPREVAQAAEAGGGWSGRSVPFLVFLTGEDELAAEILAAVEAWIIKPGVWVNFGPGQRYTITPESLTKLLDQSGEKPAQPPQPQPTQPPPADRPATAQRVQMSLDEPGEPDRADTENASKLVDALIDRGTDRAVALSEPLRRQLVVLAGKKLPLRQQLDLARRLIARNEPLLAEQLGDTLLAAWLAGAARATAKLSDFPAPAADSPSPAPPVSWPLVHLPVLDATARDLARRRIVSRADFDALSAQARATAFTAARVSSEDALHRVADALAQAAGQGGTQEEFAAAVDEALGDGALTPGHIENIFRTNVSQMVTTGLLEVLDHPLVSDEFPYLAYHACHDNRTRPNHLSLESYGLDGTNVYRRDDPFWQKFTPPWDYQDRCTVVPMSVSDAAAAGVREAQDWLATGQAPERPQWVEPPPFEPPPGWSTRPPVRLGLDGSGHAHAPAGSGKGRQFEEE